ncbi:hypothetical protein RJ55_05286 [Drechmeria coniospora]|nr:hypothetical protein RJ55_05286 [Drechmeria coniospora]
MFEQRHASGPRHAPSPPRTTPGFASTQSGARRRRNRRVAMVFLAPDSGRSSRGWSGPLRLSMQPWSLNLAILLTQHGEPCLPTDLRISRMPFVAMLDRRARHMSEPDDQVFDPSRRVEEIPVEEDAGAISKHCKRYAGVACLTVLHLSALVPPAFRAFAAFNRIEAIIFFSVPRRGESGHRDDALVESIK